jgi:hypothetical protein
LAGDLVITQVFERVYSQAATDTGPAADEVLGARLLSFDLSGPCGAQFASFFCDARGVLNYGLPCDPQCGATCTYAVAADDPNGASLAGYATCQVCCVYGSIREVTGREKER